MKVWAAGPRFNKMVRKACLVLLVLPLLLSRAEALHLSAGNLNLPGSSLVEKTEIIFEHRFYGNAGDDPLYNFFGMDAGANVALGLGFRFNDKIDLTLLRATLDKEYYLAGKYALADGLTLLLGGAAKTSSLVTTAKTSLVGQLICSRGFRDNKINFSVIPSFTNPRPADPTFALGLAGGLSFDENIGYLENIEIIAEYVPVISGYAQKYATAALGLKAQTWGHCFTLVLTNSFQTLPGGYLTGSQDNNYYLGFNIIRKF
jgi:hypothetical protein